MFTKNIYYAIAIFASLFFFIGCIPSANLNRYDEYRFTKQANDTLLLEGKVKVTFLGVATLLIDDGETQLLTDGFITRTPLLKTIFGKIESDKDKVISVINLLNINRLKAVFTAHSHYDHAMDAPNMAKCTGASLYGSKSTLNIGRGAGLPENQMELYQPNKPFSIGKFIITIIPSKHTPDLKFLRKKSDIGKEITKPLQQPNKLNAFVEGGTYDILVQHGQHSILIKASTNFIPNALDNVKAEVLFLGIATLSKQTDHFQNDYYAETIGKVHPQIVIPIHWDNFFKPLNDKLKPYPALIDNVKNNFDFLAKKTKADNIQFRIMQGYESVILF